MQARIGPRGGTRVGERQSLEPRLEVEGAVEAILDVDEAAEAKVPAPRNEVDPFEKNCQGWAARRIKEVGSACFQATQPHPPTPVGRQE